MKTVVVRLADPSLASGELHGLVEVVGGATSAFVGAAELMARLAAAAADVGASAAAGPTEEP